jgi:hypothetical protein
MLVAPVVTPADKVSGLAEQDVYLPEGTWPGGGWIEWPTGKHLAGGNTVHRSFSIDQTPVYLKEGAIVPMQPPRSHTGQRRGPQEAAVASWGDQKPVDPLIINVWPLAPGSSSTYTLYEDSGVSVEYQHGVFARTPIEAKQSGDTLRVEILPVEGSYPGMLHARSYELRLPADWPPDHVTVNGAPVLQAGPTGKGGWSFEGNTLTTVVSVPTSAVTDRVTVEVHRATGLTARRSEFDGFPGAMTRLRSAYDAMNQLNPVTTPPDPLIDATQSGDRLGYHPEKAAEELAHFREVLPKAQAALDEIAKDFPKRVEQAAKWVVNGIQPPADLDAQKQRRLDAFARAQKQVAEAGK